MVRAPMGPDDHVPPTALLGMAAVLLAVLGLLVKGRRNKEIAVELALNIKTVETYRSRLMKRFACSSPAELVRHAIRAGLAVA